MIISKIISMFKRKFKKWKEFSKKSSTRKISTVKEINISLELNFNNDFVNQSVLGK